MVTRNIAKDTATQVNSNLIGVKVLPGEGESANCTVSYSVDGKVFTNVDPVLTDDNNVIANIPRYMYLKFSQDVVITVE